MIQGAKYWKDRERLYVQDNNAIELLVPGLEYCGPTAMVDCIVGLVEAVNPPGNEFGGQWEIQIEDYVTAFFIDKRNWNHFKRIRTLDFNVYPPNRIPQYYPTAAKQIFGMTATYYEDGTFEKIAKLCWEGNAVQICSKKPGHYLAALAYDDKTKQIGFRDPWAGNRWPDGETIPDVDNMKWFSKHDFNDPVKGIHAWHILYHKV